MSSKIYINLGVGMYREDEIYFLWLEERKTTGRTINSS